jgi:HK97 gp10 family phage protein
MADFGLKIDGVNELLKVMDGIEKDMEAANIQATRAGARQFIKGAKSRCPVGTKAREGGSYPHQPGNLRKSIKGKILKPKNPGQVAAICGPEVGPKAKNDGYYGYWVEYGTNTAAPNPFMRKTEDEDKQKVDNVMALEYKKALDGKLEKGKALEALEELIEGD